MKSKSIKLSKSVLAYGGVGSILNGVPTDVAIPKGKRVRFDRLKTPRRVQQPELQWVKFTR